MVATITPDAPAQAVAPGIRGLVLAVASLLVAAVVLAVIGLTAAPSAQAQRLAETRRACQMWSSEAAAVPDPTWCADLATWMRQQMSRHLETGQMMWATPAEMRDTCRRWAAAANRAPASCDAMVDWMTLHVRGSQGWMMPGGMMGSGSR